MRFDRLITLNIARPLRRIGLASSNVRLPILMYHSVSDDPENGVPAYYKTATSPAVFRQHMMLLSENGCRSISLLQAIELLARDAPLDAKTVVITFDDGFRDFYTKAFPLLREHGFTATVFLPTAYIQSPRRSFKGRECLTWREVLELRDCGVSFGSHTATHPKLLELGWGEVEEELRSSKTELEQQLGEPITTFAYPYAFPQSDRDYANAFKTVLAGQGYVGCATTEIGRACLGGDPYCLKRLPVNSLDDRALFRAKIEGAYDWLGVPQAMVKRLKPLVFHRKKRRAIAPQTAEISLKA